QPYSVAEDIISRQTYCLAVNGSHFEHLLSRDTIRALGWDGCTESGPGGGRLGLGATGPPHRGQLHRKLAPALQAGPHLYYFISQLKDRFLNHKGILKSIQTLLPKNIVRASDEDLETAVQAVVNQWPNDVDASPEPFFNELKMWRRNFLDQKNLLLMSTDFISSLNKCNEIIFPCTHKALKLFCTLPVTTATPEWSFSTLRCLKTY
ncbi:hypothetical protein ANN_01580, partial [Periplaneta americana]